MNYSRMIGNNIALELSSSDITPDVLKTLGYSDVQIAKLLEGRLVLMRDDIQDIASVLQVSVESLEIARGNEAYSNLVHNMGYCNDEEDQDFIFDIFDMYADLKEAVNNQKK